MIGNSIIVDCRRISRFLNFFSLFLYVYKYIVNNRNRYALVRYSAFVALNHYSTDRCWSNVAIHFYNG